MTLNADPGIGIFALAPFTPTMSFNFLSGSSFTQADLFTPLANIQIRIVDLGGGLRGINFSGFGGPFGGSMDFINASSLSFQPGFGPLYFADNGASFGSYTGIAGATAVPEPATPALSGTFGLVGLAALARRRKAIAA
ncbi:MAG: PEP-CTERM sorting domain-containing protein [Isosphaeraceae bacterium]|nr:PEP-CTERM sorting domain-containing protein [Isosphaeraceae bacterium]